jgi:predicted transcriptional regulator
MPSGVHFNDRQIEKILKYNAGGISSPDIAKMLSVSPSAVQKVIQRYLPTKADRKALEIFKTNKADILSIFQRKMLYSITDEQIDAMSVSQKMMAFGILFDKERLLRGQPTSISAIASVIRSVRDKQKEVSERLEHLRHVNQPGDTPE